MFENTAIEDNMQMPATPVTTEQPFTPVLLHCPKCNKAMSSKSGLTLHLKKCQTATPSGGLSMPASVRPEHKVTDINPHTNEFDGPDDNFTLGPRNDTPRRQKSDNDKGVFGGAFVVIPQVPVYLDIGFALFLGDYILEHGSENKALLAFAHQLRNLECSDE